MFVCLFVGWLVEFLWRINLCRLFNAKFCLYVYTFNQRFLNEYLVGKFSISRISFVFTWLISFSSSYIFVQSCLSQEGQNVIYFHIFEQFGQTIPFEKSLSDYRKSSAFYKNVFNRASCLTHQTLWLWFLFQYESESKPCMTNSQSGYNDLFSSRCSKSWSPFSQGELNLEEFLWMFMSHRCCHFLWRNLLIIGFKSVYGMEITLGLRSKADLAAESAFSFPLTPTWLGIQHKIIFLSLDIESSLLSSLDGVCWCTPYFGTFVHIDLYVWSFPIIQLYWQYIVSSAINWNTFKIMQYFSVSILLFLFITRYILWSQSTYPSGI